MDDTDFDTEAAAEAATEAATAKLKDKYDPALVRAYLRENAVYDKQARSIREQSKDNKSGRAAMKKKYASMGIDTSGVDDIVSAFHMMRQANVPPEHVSPLFNLVDATLGGGTGVVALEDTAEVDDTPDE